MENLGNRIQEERRKRKLTLEQLSPKTGLSKSFLSPVERGLAQPSLSSLKKISQQFGVSVVSFYADESSNHAALKFPRPYGGKKTNSPLYSNKAKVARRALRKSLTLPGFRVSCDLLTPDLNSHWDVMNIRI